MNPVQINDIEEVVLLSYFVLPLETGIVAINNSFVSLSNLLRPFPLSKQKYNSLMQIFWKDERLPHLSESSKITDDRQLV